MVLAFGSLPRRPTFSSCWTAAPTGSAEITAIPGDERAAGPGRACLGGLRHARAADRLRLELLPLRVSRAPRYTRGRRRRPRPLRRAGQGVDSRAGADPSRRRRTDALGESPHGQGPNSLSDRNSRKRTDHPPHRVRLPRPESDALPHGQRAQGGRDRRSKVDWSDGRWARSTTDEIRAPGHSWTGAGEPRLLGTTVVGGRACACSSSSASTTPVIRPGFGCSWPATTAC